MKASDLITNPGQPTPPLWGNIAASLIAVSAVMQMYEGKITAEWYTPLSLAFAVIAAVLIVFTKAKK